MNKNYDFQRFFNSDKKQNGFRQKSNKQMTKIVDIVKPKKMNASRTSN